MGEVKVTADFLNNFAGDNVRRLAKVGPKTKVSNTAPKLNSFIFALFSPSAFREIIMDRCLSATAGPMAQ